MAGRVNTKFILVLGGAIAVATVGGGLLAQKMLQKDPREHVAIGDAFVASGDYEKAMSAYSRAVNKDQNNAEYISKWIEAMEKTTPASRSAYSERFYRSYIPALLRLADVKRDDVVAHQRVLEPMYQSCRLQPSVGMWTELAKMADDAQRNFPEGSPGRGKILRYRALARVGLIQGNFEITDDLRAQCKADIDEALKADPADDMVAAGLGDWGMEQAERLRVRGDLETADKVTADTMAQMEAYLLAHPPASPVRLSFMLLEFSDKQRATRRGQLRADELKKLFAARGEELMKSIEETDAAKIDELVLTRASELTVVGGVKDAIQRAATEVDRALIARPNEPVLMTRAARLAMQAAAVSKDLKAQVAGYERSLELHQRVIDMPNLPMSRQGIVMMAMRDESIMQQGRVVAAMVESVQGDPAALLEAIEKAKPYREKLAVLGGTLEPARHELTLLDGRIAVASRKLGDARRLLVSYNDQTNRQDKDGLLRLAALLLELRDLGAAEQQFDRLLEIRHDSAQVYLALGDIYSKTNRLPEALKAAENGLAREENTERRADIQAQIETLANMIRPSDPAFIKLAELRTLLDTVTPNTEAGLKVLRDISAMMIRDMNAGKRPNVVAANQTIRGLVALQKSDEAEQLLTAFKAGASPIELARIKPSEDLVKAPKTRGEAIEQAMAAINTNEQLTDTQKSIQRFFLLANTGQTEKANAEFETAKALDPNHPVVVSRLFELAVSAGKFEDARVYAAKAEALDLDNCHGLMFKAQLALAEKKLEDAAAFAKQAVEVDKLNALAWRIKGEVAWQMGKNAEALADFQQAHRIRGDDIVTIVALARAQIANGQPNEALTLVRANKQFTDTNGEFAHLWLMIETEFGDAKMAMERRKAIFNQNPANPLNTTAYLHALIRDRNWDEYAVALNLLKEKGFEDNQLKFEALLFGAKDEIEKGVETFNRSIANLPENERIGREHFEYARLALAAKVPKLAVAVLEDGLKYQKEGTADLDRQLGDILFDNGEHEAAEEVYLRVLSRAKEDKDSIVTLRLAECYLRSAKYEKAIEFLKKATVVDPRQKQQILVLQAQSEGELGKFKEGRATLNSAIAIDPKRPEGYLRRAQMTLIDPANRGQASARAEATADLEQSLRLDASFLPARTVLASVMFQSNQVDRAISLMREGLTLDPTNDQLRLSIVQDLLNLGRAPEALQLLEDAVARSGGVKWLAMAGDTYASQGNFEKAAEMYGRIWERSKDIGTAERYTLMLLSKTPPDSSGSRLVLAEPSLKTDSNPGLLLVRARIGMIDNRTGEMERDAKAAFALLKQDDPTQVAAYFIQLVNQVFRKPGETRGAVADAHRFVEAMRPRSGFSEAVEVNLAAIALSEPALADKGIATLTQLADSGKDKTVAFRAARALGTDAFNKKRYEECVAFYKRAKELNPDGFENLNDLALVLARQLGKFDEALPSAERAVQLAPNNVFTLTTLGVVQSGLSQNETAEVTLRRAIALTQEPGQLAIPMLRLAELKLRLGDKATAGQIFDDLKVQIAREREPKRLRETYGEDIDRLEAALKGGS